MHFKANELAVNDPKVLGYWSCKFTYWGKKPMASQQEMAKKF
jgi:hypothetical protein